MIILDNDGGFIEYEIRNMKRYLTMLQKVFEEKIDDFETNIEKDMQQVKPENIDEYFQLHEGEYWDLSELFPYYIYSSFIVSWYSYMEHTLNRFCEDIYKNKGYKITLKDMADKGIRRAKMYLIKVADITLIDNHWNELALIGDIRNAIVHKSGNFLINELRNNQTLKSYLKKHQILSDDGLNWCKPNIEYCNYLTIFSLMFFHNLFYDAGRTISRTSFVKEGL